MFADSDNLEWLVRGVVVVALLGGIGAVAHEVGYQVGTNSPVVSTVDASAVLDIKPTVPETLPNHVLIPQETVGGSGTTYKTVVPEAVVTPPVAEKKQKRRVNKNKTRKVEPAYQKPYSELSENELASLKAASR